MHGDPHRGDRLEDALVRGTPAAIEGWLEVGPGAVDRLRDELTGAQRVAVPDGTPDRLVLDNLMAASHAAAAAYPDAFLRAFAEDRWDDNPFVCSGLGAIHRPEVTERLMRILAGGSKWLRIDAAVALRGHRHPDLEAALTDALADPDELVRYHVEQRIAEIGGGSAE